MKKVIILSIACAIAVSILVVMYDTKGTSPLIKSDEDTEIKYEVRRISVDSIPLQVEIADDGEKQRLGLMHRESLAEDHGMLFVFEKEQRYSFWMMNMSIALDIIWFNSEGYAVYIVENAEPCFDPSKSFLCTYMPDKPAKYVLEVNSGFVKKHGIKLDSKLEFHS